MERGDALSPSDIEVKPKPEPPGRVAAERLSPNEELAPDENTVEVMRTYGIKSAVAALKICVDTSGAVTSADIVRSSCFPRFDARIVTTAKTWRYKPATVDSIPTASCKGVYMVFPVPARRR